MTSIADLRKQSSQLLDSLKSQATAKPAVKREVDTRFWNAPVNEDPNVLTECVIRFLPPVDGSLLAYVRYFSYQFKGPNGWYWEKIRTSLGAQEKDPMSEHMRKIWKDSGASEIEDKKKAAERAKAHGYQTRKDNIISNILVISDPVDPANNGTVRLFNYGPKIFDSKIKPLMFPNEASGDSPENPFDFFTGKNFVIRAKKQGEWFKNYDASSFANQQTPIAKTDAEIEAIWKKQYDLNEFIDPASFKSYEELQKRVVKVFGLDTPAAAKPAVKMQEAAIEDAMIVENSPAPAAAADEGDLDVNELLKSIGVN